ncbi:unnamed protein product [Vitrella brassicaformis CCMP3155]|uniref:Uncharacterized protein n=2 Tax=Vitrella brassicaformis TaxID=1169539 RepID=A0A0G4ESI0_VITBC|nr:unnamed protein product [Vitrella brassicaformis CCMP3155]|eukprot:CEM00825.1 unnamed protein product [Vitrella brassicaformis CCMP3155]
MFSFLRASIPLLLAATAARCQAATVNETTLCRSSAIADVSKHDWRASSSAATNTSILGLDLCGIADGPVIMNALFIAIGHNIDVGPSVQILRAFKFICRLAGNGLKQLDKDTMKLANALKNESGKKQAKALDVTRRSVDMWAKEISFAMRHITSKTRRGLKDEICLRDWNRPEGQECPKEMPRLCAFGYECSLSTSKCVQYQYITAMDTIGAPIYVLSYLMASPVLLPGSMTARTVAWFLRHKYLFYELAQIHQEVHDEVFHELPKTRGVMFEDDLDQMAQQVTKLATLAAGLSLWDWLEKWDEVIWSKVTDACASAVNHITEKFVEIAVGEEVMAFIAAEEAEADGQHEAVVEGPLKDIFRLKFHREDCVYTDTHAPKSLVPSRASGPVGCPLNDEFKDADRELTQRGKEMRSGIQRRQEAVEREELGMQ